MPAFHILSGVCKFVTLSCMMHNNNTNDPKQRYLPIVLVFRWVGGGTDKVCSTFDLWFYVTGSIKIRRKGHHSCS